FARGGSGDERNQSHDERRARHRLVPQTSPGILTAPRQGPVVWEGGEDVPPNFTGNLSMNPAYVLHDASAVFSPALLFYKDLIRQNIALAVQMAGAPERLRPHVKTHKTREIVRMELDAGITRHKCATLAEAEMLAGCGVPDVLLAYNLVG